MEHSDQIEQWQNYASIETNLRCQIVIDQSSSMYYPEANYGKMKFSVLAAAAITYLLHKQRDAVGLHTFSDQLELETQVKSSASHIHKLFIQYNELLEKQKTTKRTNVASILHQLAEKVHRRSLVVIFSDMFDNEENEAEVLAALQHLKHKRHEVLLFHVTDHKTELDFDFEDRPYEFIDAETKEKVKLNPASIKKNFSHKFSIRAENYFKSQKKGQFQIPTGTSGITRTSELIIGAPTKINDLRFRYEIQKFIGTGDVAINPNLNLLFESEQFFFELPIYFFRKEKESTLLGLNGGIFTSWQSDFDDIAFKSKNFNIGLFIGTDFDFGN
uniref:DUF58 domain-containing protein n=1 Tax=Roseivirga sp. TaxID=1964215 RepID=UPI0040484288